MHEIIPATIIYITFHVNIPLIHPFRPTSHFTPSKNGAILL